MINIDSTAFDVPLKVLSRNFELLFKTAERSQAGTLKAEPIGTLILYEIECGQSLYNQDDYDALVLVVSDPNYEHEITLPDGKNGSTTFDCYFASASDDVKEWRVGNINLYRSLRFSVIPISPQRLPT